MKNEKMVYGISAGLMLMGVILLLTAWKNGGQTGDLAYEKEETLTFAVYGDDDTQRIAEQAVQSFQDLNHCKVEIYCYGTEAELQEQVLGQAAGGKGFDVFYVSASTLEILKEADEVQTLDEILQRRKEEGDLFYPIALESGKIGEIQYALPVGVEPYMIYYNQTKLEQVGIEDPQTLFQEKKWTCDQVIRYLSEIWKKTGETALKIQNTEVVMSQLAFAEGNHLEALDVAGVLNDATLKKWKALFAAGAMELLSEDQYMKYKESFENGEELFIIGNLSMTRGLYDADFSWDILPFPAENSDFSNSIVTVPMIAAGKGEHQELAGKFVNYYVSTLGQKLRLESGECLLPSLSMVFYTSMGDVAFPEHSNYYFFAIENGYSSEKKRVTEELAEKIKEYLEGKQ